MAHVIFGCRTPSTEQSNGIVYKRGTFYQIDATGKRSPQSSNPSLILDGKGGVKLWGMPARVHDETETSITVEFVGELAKFISRTKSAKHKRGMTLSDFRKREDGSLDWMNRDGTVALQFLPRS